MNKRLSLEANHYSQWRYRAIGYTALFTLGAVWVLAADWLLRVT